MLKNNKKGLQLLSALIAITVSTIMVSSVTAWQLSMKDKSANMDKNFETDTIAITEWDKLSNMPMSDIIKNKDKLSNYQIGDYTIQMNFESEGKYGNAKCNTISDSNVYKDCLNISMKIKKDNEIVFDEHNIPLKSGNLSFEEIKQMMSSYVKNGNYTTGSNEEMVLYSEIDEESEEKIKKEIIKAKLKTASNATPLSILNYAELLGPPDFNKMQKVKLPFIAPDTGYIFVLNSAQVATDDITPNGTHIAHILCFNFTGSMWYPLNQGDKIFWSYSNMYQTSEIYYVPSSRQKGIKNG